MAEDGRSRLRRRRLTAQMLAGPAARDPLEVAERLLATQAQDLRGAQLAIRARSRGLTVADVDSALTQDRSLVVTWLNRGTLHLVRAEDYPMLHALTTPPLHTGNARRLAQEGVSPSQAEKGVRTIRRALADGPMTRAQLGATLDSARVPTKGQALIHLLFLAALRGLIVRGPMVGKEQAWVLTEDWLGPMPHVDRDAALVEFARRYLVGHGPATDRDLAKWSGLPLRDVRSGLARIPSLVEEEDGLQCLPVPARVAPLPRPRLLGSFEPLLLGWVSRDPVLGTVEPKLVTDNGVFRPFALVEGRVGALWKLSADGSLDVRPLRPLDARTRRELDTDGKDVVRFLRRDPATQAGPDTK